MSQPTRLRASATPIDAPIPAVAPAPTATEAATMVARMADLSVALRITSPALESTLSATYAFVFVRIVFVASAPAPLTRARRDQASRGRHARRRGDGVDRRL